MPNTLTSFVQVGTATLGIDQPLATGYVRVAGNKLIQHELTDKSRVVFVGLGEGEWDGCERYWVNRKLVDISDTLRFHFHPGTDGVIGDGLATISTGGNQKIDVLWANLPPALISEVLPYSGLAYLGLLIAPDPEAPSADIELVGDFRSLKCRQFDNTGTLTAYSFTTNYAWQILEILIRKWLRREGLKGADPTAGEKARIDFQSFVDTAAYNDAVIGTGAKRFQGGFAWPQRTSLAQILEQLTAASRSYLVEAAGVWQLRSDKPRASVFLATADMLTTPANIEAPKAQVEGLANRLNATYLDINPHKSATISAIARVANVTTITTTAVHPYMAGDDLEVFQCPTAGFNKSYKVKSVPSGATQVVCDDPGVNASDTAGYIGTPESRFMQRAPIENHEAHQFAIGQRGLGLTPIGTVVPVSLDFGVCDWDQVKRLLKFFKARRLGLDTTPYIIPRQVRGLRFHYDAIDATDRPVAGLLPGDVMTLDRSIMEELAGDYEIDDIPEIDPVGVDGEPHVTLNLLQYIDTAFTDIGEADPQFPGARSGNGLPDNSGSANAQYAPVGVQMTATDAGSTATVNVTAKLRVVGRPIDLVYDAYAFTGKAFLTFYFVYVYDPQLRGGYAPMVISTTKLDTLLNLGYLYLGSILTPQDGGGNTTDNGDGGSGSATTGRKYRIPPKTFIPGNWADASLAFNLNDNDGATCDVLSGVSPLDWYDFPSAIGLFQQITLRTLLRVTQIQAGSHAYLKHSEDGGVTYPFVDADITAAQGAPVEYRVAVNPGLSTELIRARFEVPGPIGIKISTPTPTDDAAVGTVAWGPSLHGGGFSQTFGNGTRSSHYLKFLTGGMGIPAGATILGVKLTIDRRGNFYDDGAGVSINTKDVVISLVDAGVVSGSNLASAVPWGGSTEEAVYGSASFLWGLALTDVKLNNANFGWVIQASIVHTATGSRTDSVTILSAQADAYYTIGATNGQATVYSGELEVVQ